MRQVPCKAEPATATSSPVGGFASEQDELEIRRRRRTRFVKERDRRHAAVPLRAPCHFGVVESSLLTPKIKGASRSEPTVDARLPIEHDVPVGLATKLRLGMRLEILSDCLYSAATFDTTS
ncbi:hypothetical protein GCM10011609_85170 [Lentzea pudingi]|uniref:Uncharacterized protein n=1 Tax=Lentzea pudingi TaxID=1789439 RepID=A0ABQ2IVV1_9PSEU|nr:hypothetical protein GCM10011609_85170 [Lentzea pudingi]